MTTISSLGSEHGGAHLDVAKVRRVALHAVEVSVNAGNIADAQRILARMAEDMRAAASAPSVAADPAPAETNPYRPVMKADLSEVGSSAHSTREK
ncbi:hypothetical protein [Roseixanthobacter glucoisosaccharinicivorans]|uniref:hypothetical protein n=1 Tax=Roseixanthobacter glucoisosaccharinicivorans TaxID=3119923 RepID=UPI003726CB4D